MIYISGPMKGIPDLNYPAFFEAERQLIGKGWVVRNPAALILETGREREYYLRADIVELVKNCTHLVLLPDWVPSWGANLEYHIATYLSMTVYHGVENVPLYH